MRQFRCINLTGVAGVKPRYAVYDLEGDRFICHGDSRSEMLHVAQVLNEDAPTSLSVIDGKKVGAHDTAN
jgi:hypothetical protein